MIARIEAGDFYILCPDNDVPRPARRAAHAVGRRRHRREPSRAVALASGLCGRVCGVREGEVRIVIASQRVAMTRYSHTPPSSPAKRGSSTPRLLGSIISVSGILGRPIQYSARLRRGHEFTTASGILGSTAACAGDDNGVCVRILATCCARGLLHLRFAPENSEGAGKTGCALHPRSRVQCAQTKCAHEHTGSAETLRPSLRNGFTAYNVLSPENGSFASVAPEKRCFSRT